MKFIYIIFNFNFSMLRILSFSRKIPLKFGTNKLFKPEFRLWNNIEHFKSRRIYTSYKAYMNQTAQNNIPPLYYYENPISWLRKKIQFSILKHKWDPEFSEEEFKRGAKQALVATSEALHEKDFEKFEFYSNSKLALFFKFSSFLWSDVLLYCLPLSLENIQLVVPTRIFFENLNTKPKPTCNIDMWYVCAKPIDEKLYLLIEIAIRSCC
uniref:Tim44-like domain-containing protein n=1 Tax=Clastoptera arizonana TaxID=38151 RepID=A0A1B6E6G3_9HEMI